MTGGVIQTLLNCGLHERGCFVEMTNQLSISLWCMRTKSFQQVLFAYNLLKFMMPFRMIFLSIDQAFFFDTNCSISMNIDRSLLCEKLQSLITNVLLQAIILAFNHNRLFLCFGHFLNSNFKIGYLLLYVSEFVFTVHLVAADTVNYLSGLIRQFII